MGRCRKRNCSRIVYCTGEELYRSRCRAEGRPHPLYPNENARGCRFRKWRRVAEQLSGSWKGDGVGLWKPDNGERNVLLCSPMLGDGWDGGMGIQGSTFVSPCRIPMGNARLGENGASFEWHRKRSRTEMTSDLDIYRTAKSLSASIARMRGLGRQCGMTNCWKSATWVSAPRGGRSCWRRWSCSRLNHRRGRGCTRSCTRAGHTIAPDQHCINFCQRPCPGGSHLYSTPKVATIHSTAVDCQAGY